VDYGRPLLIRLDAPGERDEQNVGGKAAKLMRAGFEVPQGLWLAGPGCGPGRRSGLLVLFS